MGFLFGQSGSAKTDRNNVLDAQGDLRNVFNYSLPQGEAGQVTGGEQLGKANTTLDTAMGSLGMAGDYWKKILGGRQSNLEAAAPVVNAVNDQSDALQRESATMGTGRGGGGNASMQDLETQKRAAIDKAIQDNRGKAASGVAGVGSAEAGVGGVEAGIGATQLQNAMNLLGLGENAAGGIGNLSLASQKQNFAQQQATGQGIGQLILAGLGL